MATEDIINFSGNFTEEEAKLIEENIIARLEPKIYAFSMDEKPNYLKVGDTLRAVDKRKAEWEKIFYEKSGKHVTLHKKFEHTARIENEDIYYRDYSVHSYLNSIGKKHMSDKTDKYYSKEFFADTKAEDVKEAIDDIERDYKSGDLQKKYTYYHVKDSRSATIHGTNNEDWKLRFNQQEVVNNFLKKPDRPNLLMYAVMRFGKSFTAMSCALAINAKKVLIVSAKADVVGEWKDTVEKPKCFKDYKFLTDKDLARDAKISDILAQSEDSKVAVFLTLQNLSGKVETKEACESDDINKKSKGAIKKRLQQVYDIQFDLIIVDETHYGAWAKSYGEPLKDADEDVIKEERKQYKQFDKEVTRLQAKRKLHLSGTPYNLLYDNKFTNDDIIAIYQFKDILREKEKWDNEHLLSIENGEINPETNRPYQEFDNPYFGFPQMLRFAFNLPEETRNKLQKLKANWDLNDLFDTKIQNGVAKFVHEEDVLKLLKAIDGGENVKGILGFLNIPAIKNNDKCKHMVFVLPRKYACDAMENLLNERRSEFGNLSKYEILNITGHNLKPQLDSVEKVKAKIEELENKNKRSITLTVYKMLTGVTVKQWDAMIMLKETKSAQEYDQSVFRIQNPYVKEDPSGDSTLKIDNKPQTILVDFSPMRMFTFQGLSSRIIDNISHSEQSLKKSIQEELQYFPIISYNADKLVKVEPTDLIKLIVDYNNNKGIIDSVQSLTFDKNLLDYSEIMEHINNQSPVSTHNDLQTSGYKGNDKSHTDMPTGKKSENGNGKGGNNNNPNGDGNDKQDKVSSEIKKKYKMCIACLAFYAFLTPTNIDDLDDILSSIKESCADYEVNKRIFNHLFPDFEKEEIEFIENINSCLCRQSQIDVNNALKSTNLLSKDAELTPRERALNALKNFNRFSNSEIVTPNNICDEMVNSIGKQTLTDIINRGEKILDIASKSGEFALAVYNLLHGSVDEEVLKNAIYSIPTSGIAYEFTRRIYEVLGLNIQNIADPKKLTAYNLTEKTKTVGGKTEIDYDEIKLILTQNKPFNTISHEDTNIGESKDMIKFGAVVGNPPYHEETKKDNSVNSTTKSNVFHYFQIAAINITNGWTSLIYPGVRWMHQSGKGLSKFGNNLINDMRLEKVIFYPNAADVFENIEVPDGITVVVMNKHKENPGFLYDYVFANERKSLYRDNPGNELLILDPVQTSIVEKIAAFVKHYELRYLHDSILPRSLFGIESDFIEKNSEQATPYAEGMKINYNTKIKLLANDKAGPAGRTMWFVVDRNTIKHNKRYITEWQVVVSSAHPGGQDNRNNMISIVDNNSAFGRSRIALKSFATREEAENFYKYANTNFVKYALLLSDESLTSLAKRVPDLLNYKSNATLVNFSDPIEKINIRLYELLGFTSDEITHIESTIKPTE